MLLDDGRVVSNFIVQALLEKPLTLYCDGSQTRSFCYVRDLIERLIHMMNGWHSGPIDLDNRTEFTFGSCLNWCGCRSTDLASVNCLIRLHDKL